MIFTFLYLFICAISTQVQFSFGEFVTVAILDIIFAVVGNMFRSMRGDSETGRIRKW